MESPTRITKAQLLEKVRKEVDFQEKKKLLESKISNIKSELSVLTEEKSNKKQKNEKNVKEEGFFQNAGRAVGNAFSGAKQIGQNMKQNYQQGSDTNKLKNITVDIQNKQKELDNLKKQYKFLTTQGYSNKGAKGVVPVARNQQGVIAKKPVVSTPAPAKVAQKRAQTQAPTRKVGTKAGITPNPTVRKKIAENKK